MKKEPWVATYLLDGAEISAPMSVGPHEIPRPFIKAMGDTQEHRYAIRRAVACVNACKGLATEYLEDLAAGRCVSGHLDSYTKESAALLKQRDELLSMLTRVQPILERLAIEDNNGNGNTVIEQARDDVRAALTKCRS